MWPSAPNLTCGHSTNHSTCFMRCLVAKIWVNKWFSAEFYEQIKWFSAEFYEQIWSFYAVKMAIYWPMKILMSSLIVQRRNLITLMTTVVIIRKVRKEKIVILNAGDVCVPLQVINETTAGGSGWNRHSYQDISVQRAKDK